MGKPIAAAARAIHLTPEQAGTIGCLLTGQEVRRDWQSAGGITFGRVIDKQRITITPVEDGLAFADEESEVTIGPDGGIYKWRRL